MYFDMVVDWSITLMDSGEQCVAVIGTMLMLK